MYHLPTVKRSSQTSQSDGITTTDHVPESLAAYTQLLDLALSWTSTCCIQASLGQQLLEPDSW